MSVDLAVFHGRDTILQSWGDSQAGDTRLLDLFEKCARTASGEVTGVWGWALWGASFTGYGVEKKSVTTKVAEYYSNYQEALGALRDKKLPFEKLSDEMALGGVHGMVTIGGSFLFHALVQKDFERGNEISKVFGDFVDSLQLQDLVEAFFLFDADTIYESKSLYYQTWLVNWVARSEVMLPTTKNFTDDKCVQMIEFFVNRLNTCQRPLSLIELFFAKAADSDAIFQVYLNDEQQKIFKAFVCEKVKDLSVEEWSKKLDLVDRVMHEHEGWEILETALSQSQDEKSKAHADVIIQRHQAELYPSGIFSGERFANDTIE
ncbi:MAG: hypothetical protein P0S94_00290 [Simkaniaceae bacterium]|nr:hypothetical protein [Simkaniaceae bacterium]